jgi:hypothetical protein
MEESRSCGPEPLIRTAAGKGPGPAAVLIGGHRQRAGEVDSGSGVGEADLDLFVGIGLSRLLRSACLRNPRGPAEIERKDLLADFQPALDEGEIPGDSALIDEPEAAHVQSQIGRGKAHFVDGDVPGFLGRDVRFSHESAGIFFFDREVEFYVAHLGMAHRSLPDADQRGFGRLPVTPIAGGSDQRQKTCDSQAVFQ